MKQTHTLLSYLGSFLLALVLASIIWLNATQVQDPITTQFLQLDVNFDGQPENSILVSPERQTVQLRIEGPQSTVDQVSITDFIAFVDLTQASFGETVVLPIEITSSSPDLELSPIPNEVDVLLEQQVSRDIPVELDIRGDVARGHAQGNPLVEPSVITVSGPSSQVEELDFALEDLAEPPKPPQPVASPVPAPEPEPEPMPAPAAAPIAPPAAPAPDMGHYMASLKQLEDRYENLVRILLDRDLIGHKDLDELM